MMGGLSAFARLVRLPNTITAAADVMAGAALVGLAPWEPRVLVAALGSAALYAGGIALNDRLDLEKDRKAHPERVLPQGLITPAGASFIAAIAFLLGLASAIAQPSSAHLIVTGLLVVAIVVYDLLPEQPRAPSAAAMGLCRALNLARGLTLVAILPSAEPILWIAPFGHLWLVAMITVVSSYEGAGWRAGRDQLPRLLLPLAYLLPLTLALRGDLSTAILVGVCAPLLALWVVDRGRKTTRPVVLVKRAVFTLILFDALWIAASGQVWAALATALLLPLSLQLAKVIGQRGS